VLSVDRTGQVEYSVKKRLQIQGSYDARLSIRTAEIDADGNTVMIEFSGNPVKFLQGHNLFGSEDLLNLVTESILRLSEAISAPQPPHILTLIKNGSYTLSRVDINRMFALNSRAEVNAYLYALSTNSRTRSQAAVTKGSTVYLNKESRRWSFKFYGKGQESSLKRNTKQGTIDLPLELRKWVDPMLRAELTLKSNELREIGLHIASEWNAIELLDTYEDYVKRIDMAEQKPLDDVADLLQVVKPKAAVSTYHLWKSGNDVRSFLPDRTFYRHRRALLEHGIDISIPCSPEPKSNVVPFCKTIELKPAVLPHWVTGTEYFFEPRKLSQFG
jgi:II/X family phage/plasmid replication protein